MAQYRLIEISDPLISNGKPYWEVQKKILGLWWSKELTRNEFGIFFNKEDAIRCYDYYANGERISVKLLKQNKV
jgi:hypothetical protein